MKDILLGICDPDDAYLNRLNGYIQSRDQSPFDVRTYTCPENAVAEEGRASVLLLNTVFYEAFLENEALSAKPGTDMGWQQILLLDEGHILHKKAGEAAETMPLMVGKYQSARVVYEVLLDACGQRAGAFASMPCGDAKKTRILGVYSPENKRLQRSFARTKAKSLCREFSCLYISFEEFDPKRLRGRGLSEVILMLKEGAKDGDFSRLNLMAKMENYVEKEGNLEILPPVTCPYDLKEIGEEEWSQWFKLLTLSGRYEVIVVNFGSAVPYVGLLSACERIYVPWTGEEEGLCMQFKEILDFMGYGEIIERAELVLCEGEDYGLL